MYKRQPVEIIKKVAEGRPHVVDAMKNSEVNLIVNTTEGRQSILDSASIRRTALEEKSTAQLLLKAVVQFVQY